jgi:hypothetical protein
MRHPLTHPEPTRPRPLQTRSKALGLVIDFFTGVPGSALVISGGAMSRFVGLPTEELIFLLTAPPRPPRFPGKQAARQLSAACTPGRTGDALIVDVAIGYGPAGAKLVKQGVPTREYDMHMVNVMRECQQIVPQSCAKSYTRDVCVVMITEQHERECEAALRGGLGPAAVAGAVFGAAAGALLMVGLAMLAGRAVIGRAAARRYEKEREGRRAARAAAKAAAPGGGAGKGAGATSQPAPPLKPPALDAPRAAPPPPPLGAGGVAAAISGYHRKQQELLQQHGVVMRDDSASTGQGALGSGDSSTLLEFGDEGLDKQPQPPPQPPQPPGPDNV